MKKIFFFLLTVAAWQTVIAQNVGIGTSTPNASAMLEINSSNKGLLLPRVADTLSVASPAKGLVIYSNSNNKLWYYDGNRWQQAVANAGGMDSIWYKSNDTIAYTAKPYVGINADLSLLAPQANLQVTGSLLVQGKLEYSDATPTPAQTFTMNNTGSAQNIPNTDSVFRIYDPGGTGNYNNNMQGNIFYNSQTNGVGTKLSSNAADFGIGTGDTLWISETNYPACRTNYAYRFTNTTVNPADMILSSTIHYYIFRSNADGINNKGFNFTLTRLFNSEPRKKIHTAGPAFYFNNTDASFAAGLNANANGLSSTATGGFTNASGDYSSAMGYGTEASGVHSTAMGYNTIASGVFSTAMGYGTTADGSHSIAMGIGSNALGQNSTAMGNTTSAEGTISTAMGSGTVASGAVSTAMGFRTNAGGNYSTAMGRNSSASGDSSTALGVSTVASGAAATAMGKNTTALGQNSTAMGKYTDATGYASTAMGDSSGAIGAISFASGFRTRAIGDNSTAMGSSTRAIGENSTAMGYSTEASGAHSTAMGGSTYATGDYSTAMGFFNVASGKYSTTMGISTGAAGQYSIAMGRASNAGGESSTAMGHNTNASGENSTAIGYGTNASGESSTAMGANTTASGDRSTAIGSYVSTNNHVGSLVIGDNSTTTIMNAGSANSFRARFDNGYRFYTSADLTTNCVLAAGSNAWSTTSDVRLKENFAEIDGEYFLQKISTIPLSSWNYKKQNPKTFRHYGPMAQDFYAAFGKDQYGTIGNDTTINSADFDGVNMIAIQALEKRTSLQQQDISSLKKEIEELKAIILQQNKILTELKGVKK